MTTHAPAEPPRGRARSAAGAPAGRTPACRPSHLPGLLTHPVREHRPLDVERVVFLSASRWGARHSGQRADSGSIQRVPMAVHALWPSLGLNVFTKIAPFACASFLRSALPTFWTLSRNHLRSPGVHGIAPVQPPCCGVISGSRPRTPSPWARARESPPGPLHTAPCLLRRFSSRTPRTWPYRAPCPVSRCPFRCSRDQRAEQVPVVAAHAERHHFGRFAEGVELGRLVLVLGDREFSVLAPPQLTSVSDSFSAAATRCG